MADGFAAAVNVKIGAQRFNGNAAVLGQPADNHLGIAHAVKLGAVAGGKNHRFGGSTAVQVADGIRQYPRGESQFFPNVQRGGLVVEADNGEFHGGGL